MRPKAGTISTSSVQPPPMSPSGDCRWIAHHSKRSSQPFMLLMSERAQSGPAPATAAQSTTVHGRPSLSHSSVA